MSTESLYDAVKRHAQLTPKAPALRYMGRTLSYRTLLTEIDRFAGVLAGLGVKRDTVVTVSLPNIPQGIIAFYAINALGGIAHLVHPLAPAPQLKAYTETAGSELLILLDGGASGRPALPTAGTVILCAPAAYLPPLKAGLFRLINRKNRPKPPDGPNVYRYETLMKRAARAAARPFPPPEKPETATAVYLHSGGTGGLPKTVELSARAINALCREGPDILEVPSCRGLSMLSVLPMFHGFGLAMGVHAMLLNGGSNAIMPKFRTGAAIKHIKKGQANYMIGVPAMYEALLKSPKFYGKGLRRLKICFVGGDFVSKSLLDRFNRRLAEAGSACRLFEGYGLTETVTVCAVNKPSRHRAGSVGRPLRGMEIRAFSADGVPLPPGEAGELCVSGAALMNGYLDSPAETAAAFFEYEGRPFVRTGDLGHTDGAGYVFFKSRLKRLVKVSGIPVFPSEVERLASDAYPAVRDVCAVDVPDEKTDNKLVLFLTLKPEERAALTDEKLNAFREELKALIENRLSVYARPKEIIILDKLPQTPVGKIDSRTLQKEYAEHEVL